MATIRLWIMAHEVTKRATIIAFTLSPWKMRKYLLELEDARNRTIAEEMRGKIPRGWAVIYALLFIAATLGVAFAITRPPKYPIETHHNVYVWSRVKGNDHAWWISADDLPLSKWTCCPDFNCAPNVMAGYIAATAKYEERGSCKSIRASGLGWFWERDSLGNVKTW
jgi:hypothetical protein